MTRRRGLHPMRFGMQEAVRRIGGYDAAGAILRDEEATMADDEDRAETLDEEAQRRAAGAAAGMAEGEDPPNAPTPAETDELREGDVTRADQLDDRQD